MFRPLNLPVPIRPDTNALLGASALLVVVSTQFASHHQVNCGIGREQVESWGRKKRSIGNSGDKRQQPQQQQQQTGRQLGDDMTLSREILVLDLKDKPAADSAADSSGGQEEAGGSLSLVGDGLAQRAPLRASSTAFSVGQQQVSSEGGGAPSPDGAGEPVGASTTGPNLHCLTSHSLLLITCSIGLFFVLYVCLVAYLFARRDAKISVIKHQYH